MSERSGEIDAFITEAGWSDASRVALAGDMSARRYLRLVSSAGKTAVLMDADPKRDTTTPAFLFMSRWLQDHGFSAPEIYHENTDLGLLLLEDLGDDSLSTRIAAAPNTQRDIYESVIELLVALRQLTPPDLPQPPAIELIQWTDLADTIPGADRDALTSFRAELEKVLTEILTAPVSLSLRDFHADNLLWLPLRNGVRRIGILDFQDAFLTHPVYDLMSLLTDARTEVSPDMRAEMISYYISNSGAGESETSRAFAALSAQRNLRILALFARTPDKAHLIPRVRRYLFEAVEHPVLKNAKPHLIAGLPE